MNDGNLYSDEVYKAKYDFYVKELVDNVFNSTEMNTKYDAYSALIKDYATSELNGYTFLSGSSSLYSAINTLKSHVSSRESAVSNYLD